MYSGWKKSVVMSVGNIPTTVFMRPGVDQLQLMEYLGEYPMVRSGVPWSFKDGRASPIMTAGVPVLMNSLVSRNLQELCYVAQEGRYDNITPTVFMVPDADLSRRSTSDILYTSVIPLLGTLLQNPRSSIDENRNGDKEVDKIEGRKELKGGFLPMAQTSSEVAQVCVGTRGLEFHSSCHSRVPE